jgi:mediator of RNA polymerase II transcription subunit 17
VSLLESKYNPTAAKSTMSASLAANLKPGVFTYDKWEMPKSDPKKQEYDALVAAGWTMDTLTSSADSLLQAATRLEEDVKRETQYWEQVLSLHTKGWPVFKVPGEQRTIAVQFSAAEAGPLFKDRGIAALRTNKDGSIKLDQRLTMKRKALRVRCVENGVVRGTSSISSLADLPDLDVSLENMVRRAQDSLFDDELYQEMTMESRILQPLGVSLRENVIHIPASSGPELGSNREWLIDLISADDPPQDSAPIDATSKSVATLLRLHLSHLYRQRLQRRSETPPLLTDSRPPEPPASILRPLMAIWQHFNTCKPFNEYIAKVAQTLKAAGFAIQLDSPQIPAMEDILSTLNPTKRKAKQVSATDALIQRLSRPTHTSTSLSASPAATQAGQIAQLSFKLTTNLSAPVFGTEYTLDLPTPATSIIGSSAAPTQMNHFDFSSLEELQSHTNDLLALNIVRKVIAPKYPGWELAGWRPEISRIVEVNGKKARAIVGVHVGSSGVEAYRKWGSEAKVLQKERWDEGSEMTGLVDVVEGWITDFEK